MPKRTDIKSILILGAGPIVIGQACEFDYSGAQACKALREEGYRVILVNSNPATIMTDPEMADATYIEPIHWEVVRKIIEKERPDAVLPTMGGQTALNCALELERQGVLEEFGVTMIGATADAIDKAEDRRRFDVAMKKIGLETARSGIAHSMEEALAVAAEVGFPCIIRPSFTMGGSGGGIAYNREEFEEICARGLDLSPTKELLIDESLIGWKEYEMEVVRDKNDNCIIVCSIENFDAMGIHTGDSITVAPAQTLTDKEYQIMRNASMAVLREIGVETGGSNVQFAVNPKNGRLIVIEMNPRVSRSSALASKATGFPIAKVAAKLAVGYTLDELMNDITGGRTPASFEPSIDYVVTKIPRFNFEKFAGANDRLTTQMKSVGEVMAIGRTQQESLQKALRGLEVGATGFDPKVSLDDPEALTKIRRELKDAGAERIWYIADAFRAGLSVDGVFNLTNIDRWFLVQIEELVRLEEKVAEVGITGLHAEFLRQLKRKGFADARLAKLAGVREAEIRKLRDQYDLHPVYKRVDTCAAEFATDTAYMYSTYEEECEANPSTDREKIMVLGGGPNRIGQGIEFDYCCVHASLALREDGYETIMVNCNPETVSTDYDTSDRLYFEPVTLEDVLEIVRIEKPKGVIVPFVSKATGVPLAKVAARVMAGKSLAEQGVTKEVIPPYYSVKEVVLPFNKFPGVDPLLGPEMRSTGEVMGVGRTFAEAFAKAQLGSNSTMKKHGRALLSVREGDKERVVDLAAKLLKQGFELDATHGTAIVLGEAGINPRLVNKVHEGRPHIQDRIKNGEYTYIINTTSGRRAIEDSRVIRRSALQYKVHYDTTLNGGFATAMALNADATEKVISVQEMHAQIK